MKNCLVAPFFAIALVALIAQQIPAHDEHGQIITVTDEASLIPGQTIITGTHCPPPELPPQGRAINQMPGWPITIGIDPNLMFYPYRGLVFADLNNDGTLEIIASSTDGLLYAWDYKGSAMPGFPVTLVAMAQYAPAVADVDGDGDMEIAQFTRGLTSGGLVYLLDHLGNDVPGFPINVNGNYLTATPTLYDLDNDGDMEIIGGERDYPIGYLHVFEHDGTEWSGGWPVQLDHVPTGTATVGDVDSDGAVEIFYMSYDSMYLLELDGSTMAGWPRQIANANFSYQSAAMADLDGDGDLEIVVSAHKDAAGCYVFHHDGSTYPGWPKLLGSWTYCAPTVVDLEGDGALEILDGRGGSASYPSDCFWAWTASGTVKPGFPYHRTAGGGSEGPLTVADIDNDGYMEIFADHSKGNYLFGVDYRGNDLPGFPLRPSGFTHMNGATIGDVDGDGDYELGVLSSIYKNSAEVALYDLPGQYHPSDIPWETYHQSGRRDGLLGNEDRLHLGGTFAIGSTVTIYLHGEPADRASLWISRGIARRQFPALGWFYLDFAQMINFRIFNVAIPAGGDLEVPVTIPNNPGLVGKTFYFQGVTGANPFTKDGRVTNLLGRTIR